VSILAGEIVTAARLNRLQPKTYYAIGSGSVAGAASNSDVPSATVTFDTEADNAVYMVHGVWDVNWTGATTTIGTARIAVDGTVQSPLCTWQAEVATDRGTYGQSYSGTLAAAGSHTIKLVCSPAANQSVEGVNSSISVTIYEVV
jgi:hypothetical protein